MPVHPLTTLELREEKVPQSKIIEIIERDLGRPLSPQYRHYLENKPVHCGDELELHQDGNWIPGRYEWTARREDSPTFHTNDGITELDTTCLLRWPRR